MILPGKHLSLQYSLLHSGALVLAALDRPRTVSDLWEKVKKYPEVDNFSRFTLILCFLYALGAVQEDGYMLVRGKQES